MTTSKYLKQDDIGEGKLVTIKALKKENVAPPDEPPEMKWTMGFEELDKPLVMNATNIQLCERACASDDTDDWIGQRIVLYVDENVSYAGKIVGGIRIRKMKSGAATPQRREPQPTRGDAFEDDGPPF